MPDTVYMPYRIEVTRPIPAPPSVIFDIVRSPAGHVVIDASGMLQDYTGEPAENWSTTTYGIASRSCPNRRSAPRSGSWSGPSARASEHAQTDASGRGQGDDAVAEAAAGTTPSATVYAPLATRTL